MQTTTPTQAPTPAYLKAAAAASHLGISRRHLHTLSKSGRVPFAKIGPKLVLFRRADLDDFVRAATVGGN